MHLIDGNPTSIAPLLVSAAEAEAEAAHWRPSSQTLLAILVRMAPGVKPVIAAASSIVTKRAATICVDDGATMIAPARRATMPP